MGGLTMDSLSHKMRFSCGFESCKTTLPIQGMNQSLFKRAQWEITLLGNVLCNMKHFRNHTKIKENTEILAHLVTIFHQSFQFLEYIKHVEFNSTLYMFLQVCSCYRTRSWILTKTSQRKEREACYKQQSSTTQWMPNMFSSLSVDVF